MKKNNLSTIKSTGFKTPESYFGSLEDAIFSRMKEDDLSAQINSNGFKVPKDYFETFDDKILKAIDTKHQAKVISLYNWKNVAYFTGIAASILLMLNIIFTKSDALTFGDLETASIETYLLNEDLNAYEIAPYLEASELESDDFVDTHMNASDIEDYLIQNSDVQHLITD